MTTVQKTRRPPVTRNQRFAQLAYEQVAMRKDRWKTFPPPKTETEGRKSESEYLSFAQSFPALVHQCGLAQAVAFAQAKGHGPQYLYDLAKAVGTSAEELTRRSREADVVDYTQLTRQTKMAAEWLKRYAEVLLEKDRGKQPQSRDAASATEPATEDSTDTDQTPPSE